MNLAKINFFKIYLLLNFYLTIRFMSIITKDIDKAIDYLNQNKLVAIPTETVYGLAGNALNEVSIKKIFELKQRPFNHPLIMHIKNEADLSQWVSFIPPYASQLMEYFWPGPLTLVMKIKQNSLSQLITGGQETIAIRCPNHPVALSLLNQLAFPIVAPSANPFGKISPTTARHVQESFKNEDLLILDGGRCSIGIESTIIDATDPNKYQILRHGMINALQIQTLISQEIDKKINTIRVPGKLEHHYQPKKPLYCFPTMDSLKDFYHEASSAVYVLSFSSFEASGCHHYQLPSSPEKAAYELYFQLRKADASKANLIVIELPPDEVAWEGIREKILKASVKS